MKKNISFASGFTIAELLITMLISMIIAAAMVPVIGLKKVKIPRNTVQHGIAECYYKPTGFDANGDATGWKLMYYYANNGELRNAEAVEVEDGKDYCTFLPPKSDYFEIISIGAGANGADAPNPSFEFDPAGSSTEGKGLQSGYIRVDKHYQEDIGNAKMKDAMGRSVPIDSYIRRLIDAWASHPTQKQFLVTNIKFESGVNDGGPGYCKVRDRATSICDCFETAGGKLCDGPITPTSGGYFTNGNVSGMILNKESYQPEKCWFYHHVAGASTGQGGYTRNGLAFLLDSTTTIESKEHFHISNMGNEIGNGNPASFTDIDFTIKGKSGTKQVKINPASQEGGSYYDADNCDVVASWVKVCFDTGGRNEWVTPENPSVDASCEDNSNGAICNQLQWVPDPTMYAAGMQNGIENDDSRTCDYNYAKNKIPAKVYYPIYNGNQKNQDPRMLKWIYSGMMVRSASAYGGDSGTERVDIYEHLNKKLYLYPAKNAGVYGSTSSYVRPDLESGESLVTATSGKNLGRLDNMSYSVSSNDMPIPSQPLEWAKPGWKSMSYMTKITASKFKGGLNGCNDPHNPWCPGFGGKGVYFYLKKLPASNSLTLKNLFNNKSYTISTDQIIGEKEVDINNPYCDDGITVPQQVTNYSLDYLESQMKDSIFYCREPKRKGSPGAVIIIW